MLYPLFFEPVYKNIIWGGRRLEEVFHRDLPPGNAAESWEVCCHRDGMSIVSNGPLKGKSLEYIMKEYKGKLTGDKFSYLDRFPLLIKFIDAQDNLSVQVHPRDDYALINEKDLGKTEMWYILDAKENARIIYGIKKNITREEFKKALTSGSLERLLNFVPVKKGDSIFIPSGTVHAILDGIVIAEIQQNSNTTYRVYDWNRRDKYGKSRELHIEKALEVINFDFQGSLQPLQETNLGTNKITKLVECQYFNVQKIEIQKEYQEDTLLKEMHIYTCIEGNGYITYNSVEYSITPGDTLLIPACLGPYKLTGTLTLLKTS